ncbi:hypothetical protein EV401DRAFT_2211037 [Pisolithus croceorrhizus]|nr:hypothetical protein EV401DRAFT_2211037 [Pisolithus croceorrhizus]
MHHCLRITDILDLIFGYVVDESVADKNATDAVLHGDIARFARTCTAFMDPRLTFSGEQSSLSPPVIHLPAHFSILVVDQGARVVNIVDAVFSPGLSDELSPSLRALDANVVSELPPPDPVLFFGPIFLPQLVLLSFKIPEFNRYKNPALRFVPACAPSLQVLRINAARALLSADAAFEVIPYVRSLYLTCILNVSPSSLHGLIRLQCLRDLAVPLLDGFDVGARPSMQPILPPLQRITITIFHHSPAAENDIYQLLQEIEHIPDRSLGFHTFDVQSFYPTKPVALHAFDIPCSILTDFLTRHRLRVLRLGSFVIPDVDDGFIPQITLAWPDIEVLYLCGSQGGNARVTLEGIRELLRGCSRLRLLHM